MWDWSVAFWSWVAIADEPSAEDETTTTGATDTPSLELTVCSANVKTLKPKDEKRWGQPSERRQQLEVLFHQQQASIVGLQETKSQEQVMKTGTFYCMVTGGAKLVPTKDGNSTWLKGGCELWVHKEL
jgi:hypothetical protein